MKECSFANVKDLNQLQQTSLKVSYLDDLKQKIIVPINHRETVEDLIDQNIDIGKTNTIQMSIDTGNHPPIELRQYFCQVSNWKQGSE